MRKRILSELGFAVVGPFSRLAEAMVAAVHDEIDAGVIDVNLEAISSPRSPSADDTANSVGVRDRHGAVTQLNSPGPFGDEKRFPVRLIRVATASPRA